MSEQTIYNALRAGGLTPAGACAMMGNMFCESSMKSTAVELRCPLGGADYTWNVDNGTITRQEFCGDAFGYGLCQWTYSPRKAELYDFASGKGVSIGDEQMQCEFALSELVRYYADLNTFLHMTADLPEATKRICAEFEIPAVNNFADRINAAQRFFNTYAAEDQSECGSDACPIEIPEPEVCAVNVRVLQKGCLGRDVYVLQCGLTDLRFDCGIPDGDFGDLTKEAVKALQKKNCLDVSGICDANVWEVILKAR